MDPLIIVNPNSLDFGEIARNSEKQLSLNISNYGSDSLYIEVFSNNSNFLVSDNILNVSSAESYNLNIIFSPVSEGLKEGIIELHTNDPQNPIININVVGESRNSDIFLSFNSYNFQKTSIFDEKKVNLKIKNIGVVDLIISEFSSNNTNFFVNLNNLILQPDQEQILEVFFKPDSIGIFICDLEIKSNSQNNSIVTLVGEAVSAGIYIDKSFIDFGNVTINTEKTETFLISNISNNDVDLLILDITSTNENFKETINTFRIKKGNALQVSVTFSPIVITQQLGKILIKHNDIEQEDLEIDLKGKGLVAPNIILSTNNINFGSCEVNKISKKNLKIYNTGTVPLNITNIVSDNSNFFVTPTHTSINSNSFKDFEISFLPNDIKTISGKILIYCNDPDISILEINVIGIGVSSIIEVLPTIIDFGNVTLNTTKEVYFNIYNKSQVNLTIYNIEVLNNKFQINENFPIEIQSLKQIKINFSPLEIGEFLSKIIITSNDFKNPKKEIELKGIGVSPDIFINPTNLDFFDVSLGSSMSLPISISNLGKGILKIDSIVSSDSSFSLNFQNLEIDPKETSFLNINFTPTVIGSKSALIQFNSNDFDTPSIILPVVGYGSVPILSITINSLQFGSVVVNSSLEKSFEISNIGRSSLDVTIILNSQVFSVSSNFFNIKPNSTEKITVIFSPNDSLNYEEYLVIRTNDPQNSEVQIPVLGFGIFAAKISVNQRNINFGNIPMKSSKEIEILVSNNGTKLLMFSTSIENPNSGKTKTFSVLPVQGAVPSLSQISLITTFSPNDPEQLSGILKIFSNDLNESQVNISLSGVGEPATLEWQKINTEKWIPKEVVTIASSVSDIISPLITVLDITKQVFDVIKAFIIDTSDIMTILLTEIKKTIDDFINDLSESGLYTLYILPGKPGITPFLYPQYFKNVSKTSFSLFDPNEQSWFDSVKGGYPSFVSKVVQSFDDPGDGNRPQFSDSSMVGGIVMMCDSGTIGPDDIAKFLKIIQKLMKMFRAPFKMAFEPPTNVLAFSSNRQVRITFTPSVSILPKEYFIFRSETQGGDQDFYEDVNMKVPTYDENGKPIFSYKLIGITNVMEQFAKVAGVSEQNAKNLLEEVQYGAKQLANKFLDNDPLRFIFEDNNVEDGKTYFYIVAAGYTTLSDKKYDEILSQDIYTSSFEKRIVTIGTQQEINSEPISKTKILSIGSYSSEVSAKPSNAFLEISGGLARCRNFSCGFEEDREEEIYLNTEIPEFLNISNSPVPGTVKIFIKRENEKEFEAELFSFRVDYMSKIDNKSNTKIFEGVINKIYLKSKTYFKINDKLTIRYKVKKTLQTEQKINETHYLTNDQTFLTDKKPIDSKSINLKYENKILNESEFVVLNDKDGKIKVFKSAGSSILIDYEYFKDFSEKNYFKCTRSEFSKYFFDILKCDNGTNLCPGYDNVNCLYNNGGGCTFYNNNSSSETSQRIIQTRNGFEPENIFFSDFWDPIACQNGMMKQRCDGYNKTFPRQEQKVWPDWSSLNISAISLFPKIEEIMTVLQNLLDTMLAGTEKMSSASTNFIDLLQKKIDQLKEVLQIVNSFIRILVEDFALPDLYFLNIPYAKGGNKYLKESIEKAENGPLNDSDAYTAGVVFVYGTPGLESALKLFFGD